VTWSSLQTQQTSAETTAHLGLMNSSLRGLKAEEDTLNESHTESLKQYAATQSQIGLAEDERKNAADRIAAIRNFLEGKGEQPDIRCDKCGTMPARDQWTKHIEEPRERTVTHREYGAATLTRK